MTETPTIFKKIKLATHENAGFGQINLPEEQMHTTACWIMTPESRAEDAELKVAMEGLEHLLRNTAPLFLMCDRSDIRVTSRPAIYIIDNIPGGVGLAEGAFEVKDELVRAALGMLNSCQCKNGCPACVGVFGGEYDVKGAVRALAEEILGGRQ